MAAAKKGGSRGAFPVRSPAWTINFQEPGGEAPRIETGEPLSPVPLPSGGDFAELNELIEPLSPRLEPCSDRFELRSELSAPLPSYSDGAKRSPGRVPRPANRPRRREWSPKTFPGHVHHKK